MQNIIIFFTKPKYSGKSGTKKEIPEINSSVSFKYYEICCRCRDL